MGSGYTWAKISFIGGNSVPATARASISPIKGHGWNPVEELFGRAVISYISFDGDEGGKFPINIQFRQIGLICNPTLNGSTTIANLTGANVQYTKLNVGNISGTFVEGETLNNSTTGQNGVAKIIKVESNHVFVNVVKGPISQNDILAGSTSGTTCEVITIVPHILENYSGDMLYLENRTAITKIENQSETYRLIIKF